MIGSNSLDVVFLRFLAANCGVLLPRFRCLFCFVRATFEELFSEVGDLKRYSVHYDRSGRSEGTAEMVFARQEDAVSAVNRYNNVQLDGKPLKIEIVGTNIGMSLLENLTVPINYTKRIGNRGCCY
uniref:RRM domain-containing protein n=1 Tax=Salix viminalis TaxID=40686 RepID=A0A6N2KK58_SALVM